DVQGTHNLYVWAKDSALNISSASTSIVYDSLVPKIELYIDHNPTITIITTKNIGVTINPVNVASGVSSTPNLYFYPYKGNPINIDIIRKQGNQYYGQITINSQIENGMGYFGARVTDNAGNSGSSILYLVYQSVTRNNQLNINIDLLKPSFQLFDLDTYSTEDSNDFVLGVRYTCDTRASAWLISEVQSNKPAANDPLWQNTAPVYFVLRNGVNGLRPVYLWIKDATGNISNESASSTINYDDTYPQATEIFFERDKYIKEGSSRVTINLSESVIVTPTFYLEYQGSERAVTLDYFDGRTLSGMFDVKPGEIGLVTLNLTITDNAMNVTNIIPANLFVTVNFDTITPPTPTMSVSSSGTNKNENIASFSNTVILSTNIKQDTDYYRYIIREQNVFPTENALDWIEKPFQYTLKDTTQGTRNMFLWVKDRAGNISDVYQYQIFYDDINPTGDFQIFGPNSNSYSITNTLNNLIELHKGNPDYYIVTENPWYSPTPLSAQWSELIPTRVVFSSLSEESKTAYIWLMDKSGNIGSRLSASIYYDPTIPVIGLLSSASGWISTTNVRVTLNIGENIIVTPDLSYNVQGVTYPITIIPINATRDAFVGTINISDSFPNGLLTFHAIITDNAGTVTKDAFTYGTTTFNVDTQPPTVNSAYIYDSPNTEVHTLTNDNPFNIAMVLSEATISGFYVTENPGIDAKSISSWLVGQPDKIAHDGAQGIQDLYIWIKDYANNISRAEKHVTVNYDSFIPTGTIELSPPSNNISYAVETMYVTINFNEPVNGGSFKLDMVNKQNPDKVNTISLDKYTFVTSRLVTASVNIDGIFGDGNYYFRLTVEDPIGNIGEIGSKDGDIRLTGDSSFAVATSIEAIGMKLRDRDNAHNNNKYIYTNERYIDVEMLNMGLVDYYLITSNLEVKPDLSDINIENPSSESDFVINNFYIGPSVVQDNQETLITYNIWVKGGTGQRNETTKNASIIVDLHNPSITAYLNGGASILYAGEYTVTLSIDEYIPTSHISVSKIVYSDSSERVMGFVPTGATDNHGFYNTFVATFNVDSYSPKGLMELKLTVYDKAGNTTSQVNPRATYNISIIPNPSFNISDRNSSSPLFTNEVQVSLNIISSLYAHDYIITGNTGYFTKPAADNPVWSSSSNYGALYNLASGDGNKILIFWVKDDAGNINTHLVTRSIVLDTQEPTVNLELDDNTFGIGTYSVTFNYNEPIITTPSYYFRWADGSTRNISVLRTVSENRVWIGEFNITGYDRNELVTINGYTIDRAGNFSTTLYGNATFNIDTLIANPSQFNIYDTDTQSKLYVNDFVVGLSIKGDEEAFKWLVSDTQSAKPSPNSSGWVSDKPAAYTFKNVVNEYKKLYVWVQDSYKNVNEGVVSCNIYYDDTKPETEVKFNYRPYIKDGIYPVTLNISQEIFDLVATPEFKVKFSGESAQTININPLGSSRYVWTGTINVTSSTPEGTATFSVIATDNASNVQNQINAGTSTFIVDRSHPIDPVFTISDTSNQSQQYTNKQTIGVSINADSEVYMWNISDQTGVTPSYDVQGWLTQRPTSFTFSNANVGTKNIKLWVQDNAGNIASTATKSIYFDDIMPTASVQIYPYPNVKSGIVNVTLNVSESTIDAITLNYTLYGYGETAKNVQLNKVSATAYAGTFNISENDSNGQALFAIELKDLSANKSNMLTGHVIFNVDTSAPAITIQSTPALYINHSRLSVTVNISEAVSATPSVIFHGDNDVSITMNRATMYVWGGYLDIGETLGYNRSASIDVFVYDNANNLSTIIAQPYIIDTIPAIFSLDALESYPILAVGSYMVTINSSEYTINTPNVSFVMSDNTSRLVSMGRSTDDSWTGKVIIQEGDSEGPCTISISATDFAGNITNTFTGITTFNVLITLPDPTFNVKDRSNGDEAYTNEYVVSINIGNDNTAAKWMISETQSSMPAWNASGWQSTKPETYTLSAGAQGNRLLYVWIQDAAKNINKNIVSKNIILDTVAPVTEILLSHKNYIKESEVRLTLSVQEEIMATPDLRLVYSDGSTLNLVLVSAGQNIYTGIFNTHEGDPQGITYFYLRVTDNALNVQTSLQGDSQFVLDTNINPPSFNIWDQESLRSDYTNDTIVGFTFVPDSDVAYWILDEKQTVKPAIDSVKWLAGEPWTYTFKDVINEKKVLYLWTKDRAGNINAEVVSRSIIYDTVAPTTSIIEVYDRNISENYYFVTLNLNEVIDYAPTLTYILNNTLVGTVVWNAGISNSAAWSGGISFDGPTENTKVTFNLQVRDKAGNETTQIGERIYNGLGGDGPGSSIGNFVTIEVANAHLKSGEYTVTMSLDISNPLKVTPSIMLHYDWIPSPNDCQTLHVFGLVTQNIAGIGYLATFNVPSDGTRDGQVYFYVVVTKDAGDVVTITSNIYSDAYINGINKVEFDTQLNIPTFTVYDAGTVDTYYTNDHIPRVSVTNDPDVTAWILSEHQIALPTFNSVYWRVEKPFEYSFSDLKNENKTLYLWVKDDAGNIFGSPVTSSIFFDNTVPAISGIDIANKPYIGSGNYTVTFNVSEA
ncbi:MAG: hypothetical protein DKM50_01145, partial [Candidatus Margulisiibacteriota bacterium]